MGVLTCTESFYFDFNDRYEYEVYYCSLGISFESQQGVDQIHENVLGKGLTYNFRMTLSLPICISQFAFPNLQLTITEELRLDPNGVLGRELSEELTLNSSELRFSEHSPSLRPLLMELLSSQLKQKMNTFTISVLQNYMKYCKNRFERRKIWQSCKLSLEVTTY